MRYTAAQIGKLVRDTRKKLGVTQKDLALTSGTGMRFIIDLEKGKETCEIGKALAILNTLGIKITLTPPIRRRRSNAWQGRSMSTSTMISSATSSRTTAARWYSIMLESWLNKPGATPLSQSLPLRKKRFKRNECRGFFAGILPDESQTRNHRPQSRHQRAQRLRDAGADRRRMRRRGHLHSVRRKPCRSGITATASSPRRNSRRSLKELPKRPLLAGEEGIRLSLAGAQDKVAVRIENGEVCLPLGGAPSTHILKPAVERFEGVVFNEALCMKLAAEAGLPAASVETRNVEGIDCLLVERYDRIHKQEPGAEALPLSNGFIRKISARRRASSPKRNIRRKADHPLSNVLRLLREVSSAPVIDLARLLEAVIYNYLVGNNDAHGKNFSLLYHGVGTANLEIRLAPLYDVVNTLYYPELSRDMAMKIGGEYSSEKVTAEGLRAAGRRGGTR